MADILGNKVIDIKVYNRILKYHIPFFWFCIDHGIRIVNATEGGLLFESCTCMRLENAIKMCNTYGETKDEKYLLTQGTTQSAPITDLDNDEFFGPLRKKQNSGINYDTGYIDFEKENGNGSNENGLEERSRQENKVVPCGAA